MMSRNGPPPILISSTPPSNPASVLKLFQNESWTPALAPTAGAFGSVITGESNLLSPAVVEPAENAEFGAVSLADALVTHNAGFPVLAVTQPAGSAGAVTPSKFS